MAVRVKQRDINIIPTWESSIHISHKMLIIVIKNE